MPCSRSTNRRSLRVFSMLSALLAVGLGAAGCALGPAGRLEAADAAAAAAGFQRQTFAAGPFQLTGWLRRAEARSAQPDATQNATLAVYIEGDGFAWVSKTQLSRDPTPRNPLALRLAILEPPQRHVLYLGRPCQYSMVAAPDSCDSRYWSSHRFAPEVVAATQTAIDQAKARIGAARVLLIGYSGGGGVATLVAARRTDVAALITIAGVLDHAAWTQHHRVSPLSGSLNPIAEAEKLRALPQAHIVGRDDDIVPPFIAESFVARLRAAPPLPSSAHSSAHAPSARVVLVPNADHGCCWAELWSQLRRAAAPL